MGLEAPPGRSGLIELRLEAGQRTHVTEQRQRFPLHVGLPMYLDPHIRDMAFIYIQNPSGGCFGGDRLEARVSLGRGARVHLTTGSATRVHRTTGHEARYDLEFRLAAGSYLESLPEPVIPQGGSRYRQSVSVQAEPGAMFLGAETIMAGRLARGEVFAFERLSLATEIWSGGELLVAENLDFDPARRAPSSRGLFGPHTHLASLIAVAPGLEESQLASLLADALGKVDGALVGVGRLPRGAGVILKILAGSSIVARKALFCGVAVARSVLIGAPPPPVRK